MAKVALDLGALALEVAGVLDGCLDLFRDARVLDPGRDAVHASVELRRPRRAAPDAAPPDALTRLGVLADDARRRADAAEQVSRTMQALVAKLDEQQKGVFLAKLEQAFAPGAWGEARN